MENRHKKLLGIFAMFIFLVFGLGLYCFVGFFYKHIWSLLFIVTFEILGFFTPAICFGYNDSGDVTLPSNMSETSYKNCRDIGYILGGMFYLLTFIFPTAAWAATSGANPPYTGVIFVYLGNTSIILAFQCWIRIFII